MPEPEQVDADRGIYPKYVVFKHPEGVVDFFIGSFKTPQVDNLQILEEVDDFTFTLRPSKDYHARVALAAYAESVRHWNPNLADDIDDTLDLMQTEPPRFEPT